jgi:hypothetical protein
LVEGLQPFYNGGFMRISSVVGCNSKRVRHYLESCATKVRSLYSNERDLPILKKVFYADQCEK